MLEECLDCSLYIRHADLLTDPNCVLKWASSFRPLLKHQGILGNVHGEISKIFVTPAMFASV